MTDAAGYAIRDANEYQMAKQSPATLYRYLDAAAASRPPAAVLEPYHTRIAKIEAAIAAYEAEA